MWRFELMNKRISFVLLIGSIIVAGVLWYVFSLKKPIILSRLPSIVTFLQNTSKAETTISDILTTTGRVLERQETAKPVHSLEANYSRDKRGVYSNHSHTLPSNSYVCKNIVVDQPVRDYLARTDSLEPVWIEQKTKVGDQIPWLYTYHLHSNTIRMYPWTNFSQIFGPSSEWSLVRYFRMPGRLQPLIGKQFCTRVYDDAGGTGLGLSCCMPVLYKDDFSSAILTCADFSLRTLINDLRAAAVLESSCFEQLLITSQAPDTGYVRDVVIDIPTGVVKKGNDIFDRLDKADLIFLGQYGLFNFQVYAVSHCSNKTGS